MSQKNPFKYYRASPEIIKLAVMYYIRYPLSLRQVEDIIHERGIDIFHEIIRYWWNRFGHNFSREMKKKSGVKYSNWRWHIDEVFVKINGETHLMKSIWRLFKIQHNIITIRLRIHICTSGEGRDE